MVVGDINLFGDMGGGPGKRYLFFLTTLHPENRLPGVRVGSG